MNVVLIRTRCWPYSLSTNSHVRTIALCATTACRVHTLKVIKADGRSHPTVKINGTVSSCGPPPPYAPATDDHGNSNSCTAPTAVWTTSLTTALFPAFVGLIVYEGTSWSSLSRSIALSLSRSLARARSFSRLTRIAGCSHCAVHF